jgi:hypothetical protein
MERYRLSSWRVVESMRKLWLSCGHDGDWDDLAAESAISISETALALVEIEIPPEDQQSGPDVLAGRLRLGLAWFSSA